MNSSSFPQLPNIQNLQKISLESSDFDRNITNKAAEKCRKMQGKTYATQINLPNSSLITANVVINLMKELTKEVKKSPQDHLYLIDITNFMDGATQSEREQLLQEFRGRVATSADKKAIFITSRTIPSEKEKKKPTSIQDLPPELLGEVLSYVEPKERKDAVRAVIPEPTSIKMSPKESPSLIVRLWNRLNNLFYSKIISKIYPETALETGITGEQRAAVLKIASRCEVSDKIRQFIQASTDGTLTIARTSPIYKNRMEVTSLVLDKVTEQPGHSC